MNCPCKLSIFLLFRLTLLANIQIMETTQLLAYNKVYSDYFNSESLQTQLKKAIEVIENSSRLFFIGNGGSNSISSHMMEDYGKMARIPSYAFSDPPLITCYANDYGYENIFKEWLELHMQKGDTLIAISSSGNSENIVRGIEKAQEKGAGIITLSAFESTNKIATKGDVNFHIPVKSFGIAECFHQVILHVILDEIIIRMS